MSEILANVKNMIADNNLKWKRPSKVSDTSVEFVNGQKLISFELYDNGETDCYLNVGNDQWQYTNKPEKFAGMWIRFVE